MQNIDTQRNIAHEDVDDVHCGSYDGSVDLIIIVIVIVIVIIIIIIISSSSSSSSSSKNVHYIHLNRQNGLD